MKTQIKEHTDLKVLTIDEAYDAMVDYLDKYYDRTNSADIGDCVSDLLLWADGKSFDAAVQEDWKESVDKILKQNSAQSKQVNNSQEQAKILTLHEAYNAMIGYLEGFCERTNSNEIRTLLDDMHLLINGISTNPAAFIEWKESVDKILKQNPRIRPYLQLTK